MKCNNSASFPLSAETAIFALAGQKIRGSRCKFPWNFNFAPSPQKTGGYRIELRQPLLLYFQLGGYFPHTGSICLTHLPIVGE